MCYSKEERKILSDPYFRKIREEGDLYEVESVCTRHRWAIKKVCIPGERPVRLHHKHSADIPYYHRQISTCSVMKAVVAIKEHDKYILSKKLMAAGSI